MSAADRIDALADSGTPGPWAEKDGGVYPVEGEWTREKDAADAAKIVAAVNALPQVAALLEAIEEEPHGSDQTLQDWWRWWDRLRAQVEELDAALGVDSE